MAEAKRAWRRKRLIYRPWVPTRGEHLVIDWTTDGGWQMFCAVAPWSRDALEPVAVRAGRTRPRAVTTMRLLGSG